MTEQTQRSGAHLLFVCTANVCRSPVAELLTERELLSVGIADTRVASVGLNPLTGSPIDPVMASLLGADGIDPSHVRARGITETELQESTLILTATLQQKSELAARWPGALAKTFTMREFVSLADSSAGHRSLDHLVAATRMERAYSGVRTSDLDIDDPYLRSARLYRRCYRQIAEASAQIAQALGRARLHSSGADLEGAG